MAVSLGLGVSPPTATPHPHPRLFSSKSPRQNKGEGGFSCRQLSLPHTPPRPGGPRAASHPLLLPLDIFLPVGRRHHPCGGQDPLTTAPESPVLRCSVVFDKCMSTGS